MLEKGVFNRFFDSCRKFWKSTSKIEAYAAEMEERHPHRRKAGLEKPVAALLLGSGFLLIVPATFFSLLMF